MRQIGYIQPGPGQNVALTERIVVSTGLRIEPFVDVGMHLHINVLQACVARTAGPYVDTAYYMKQPIGVAQFQVHFGRRGKRDSLEFLDRYLVIDQHKLPAGSEEPTDVDLVRLSHGGFATCRRLGAHRAASPQNDLEIVEPPQGLVKRRGPGDGGGTMNPLGSLAGRLASEGVSFAPAIVSAAEQHGLDPRLLAAVAAQETGGPGANGGRNEVGDGGHGRGVFQIDDRWHDFAKTSAAMDPAQNADYAAGMLSGLLKRYNGNVREALSAYNSGDPHAAGTSTTWGDGEKLDYADSVLRHYQQLGGNGETPDRLGDFALQLPTQQPLAQQLPLHAPHAHHHRHRPPLHQAMSYDTYINGGDNP